MGFKERSDHGDQHAVLITESHHAIRQEEQGRQVTGLTLCISSEE